jgi:hypothetical protein
LTIKLTTTVPDGFIVHSHAGDDWRTCRDYVRSKLGLPEWKPGAWDEAAVRIEVNQRPAPTEEDAIRIERAVSIWNEAGDPELTVVEDYLDSRKLQLTPTIAGTVLRFHRRCPMRNENTGTTDRVPAMIAAFRSIDNDAITGIHRIRLDERSAWPKARLLQAMLGGFAGVDRATSAARVSSRHRRPLRLNVVPARAREQRCSSASIRRRAVPTTLCR